MTTRPLADNFIPPAGTTYAQWSAQALANSEALVADSRRVSATKPAEMKTESETLVIKIKLNNATRNWHLVRRQLGTKDLTTKAAKAEMLALKKELTA